MQRTPRITDTEWEVMRIIWAHAPVTAAEIVERLAAKDPSWHPKTVRTLLNRLVLKKALSYEASGRSYLYAPLVTEQDCIGAASSTFVERVFGGSLMPMLAHFVEQKRLSRREVEELRELLDKQASPKASKGKERP
jgi:BlaI family transcriptional regulator, penicillinase repressor